MATDPTQSFSQNLQVSGSGFDQKLQAIVGIGQAVKGSQVARQQMRDQFAQQKELIQFRADTQLDKEFEYYDKVTRPQQLEEQKAQSQQQFNDLFQDQLEKAQSRREDLYKEWDDNYSSVSELGLATPVFQVDADREQGSAGVSIYMPNEKGEYTELSYTDYRDVRNQYKKIAKVSTDLEEGLREGWFPETLPEGEDRNAKGMSRITRSDAINMVQDIRRNPQTAYKHYQGVITDWEYPAPLADDTFGGNNQDSDSPSDGLGENRRGIGTFRGELMDAMSQDGTLNFETIKDGGWFGFGEDERISKSVPIVGRKVSEVIEGLNVSSQDVFGVDMAKISSITNSEVRNQILSGVSDGLEDENRELAEQVAGVKEQDDLWNQFEKLKKIRLNIEPAINTLRERADNPVFTETPISEMYISPNEQLLFTTDPSTAIESQQLFYQYMK